MISKILAFVLVKHSSCQQLIEMRAPSLMVSSFLSLVFEFMKVKVKVQKKVQLGS